MDNPHAYCHSHEEWTALGAERDFALDNLKAEIANHREDLAALEAMRETAKESSRVHVEMHNRITKLREGILEARKEGCACDFHLYAEDRDLLNDALLDVYLTQEQANREARAEADRYRTALDRVWDALTAEDKRGAFTDTLWMPDNANITVFEFIDHTLNPE